MSDAEKWEHAYVVIARNLREFGYGDVTAEMVRETHDAMKAEAELPHGIVGMFAKRQIEELLDAEGGG